MAFKTLDKTSEFIREYLSLRGTAADGDAGIEESFDFCKGEKAERTASDINAKKGVEKQADLFLNYNKNEEALRRLESLADERMIPVLLPESAMFLKQLCMLTAPKKVLEVGMGIGYSGHIILQNSPAHLYTIEHNDEFVELAADSFKASGLLERVTFLRGDESEIIPVIEGRYDLIFLDGAKTRYAQHLPFLKKLLSPRGILLADNVLFNGMVTGETKAGKKRTIVENLRLFLNNICSDADFCTSILPVGDGMSLSIKLR